MSSASYSGHGLGLKLKKNYKITRTEMNTTITRTSVNISLAQFCYLANIYFRCCFIDIVRFFSTCVLVSYELFTKPITI